MGGVLDLRLGVLDRRRGLLVLRVGLRDVRREGLLLEGLFRGELFLEGLLLGVANSRFGLGEGLRFGLSDFFGLLDLLLASLEDLFSGLTLSPAASVTLSANDFSQMEGGLDSEPFLSGSSTAGFESSLSSRGGDNDLERDFLRVSGDLGLGDLLLFLLLDLERRL